MTPAALMLRDRGLAQLENEQPGPAEATFRELAKAAVNDPLPHADLALALLRQQKGGEAQAASARALALAPGRADLLALQGDVLQWSGKAEAALPIYRTALAKAPRDVELAWALYRLAGSQEGDAAAAGAREALARLVELRPDNAVVQLQAGQRAIARGDRTAATAAFLRVGELLWQVSPQARTAFDAVVAALKEGDVAKARVPALRLENVLKPTPLYQQGLTELTTNVQGRPVVRFRDEPPPTSFGAPAPLSWVVHSIAPRRTPEVPAAIAIADFDGDERPDFATVENAELVLRFGAQRSSSAWKATVIGPASPRTERLLAVDLDNDGAWDLVGAGGDGLAAWRGNGKGGFTTATSSFGLDKVPGTAVAALDYDSEGDLDLAAAGEHGVELLRNALSGPLVAVGKQALRGAPAGADDVVASDLDRDGDLDLLFAGKGGLIVLDNRRQGTFAAIKPAGLDKTGAANLVTTADFDNDGRLDVVLAGGAKLRLFLNRGGRFEAGPQLDVAGAIALGLVAADVDNDGRLDLVAASSSGVHVFLQQPGAVRFVELSPPSPRPTGALGVADLDGDGDLDIVALGVTGAKEGGYCWIENRGGNKNHWLAVRLRGVDQGNGKNNLFGLGAMVEVRDGAAYQLREVHSDGQAGVTHIGLGSRRKAPLLRVVWTNGVPQDRLDVAGDQRIVEEQVLKGSCPFLYAWNGSEVAFVTDLLWNAPIGLPLAPGVYAGADPSELVKVEGAAPREGVYDLRLTEELWEAAYFDHVRLWVVDAPDGVEVASNLRVVPGESQPEKVLGSRAVRPVAAARDGRGEDATAAVRARDEVYADGYEKSVYQGVAAKPWSFTFDLGEAPAAPVRLLLDGWIFPADASLNLAVAQRSDLAPTPPRLEVETAAGWQPLMPAMGFPAGKTKTMVVDTPRLPAGAHRLRIVSGQWLHWDRIAWTTTPADDEPQVVAQLLPMTAELHRRGFSHLARRAPNAPHAYDYARVSQDSPWLPFPGRYTRYGDVRELLAAPDDRLAILAAGDEVALTFDARALPPPRPGFRRTVFLESHGWDKDADRNTGDGAQMEPLPFRAMRAYPYAPGERYPDDAFHREYVERWLTRDVPPAGAPAEAERSTAQSGVSRRQ
ncbi:MAG TPA: FG-GAP-like repeat-containing protein [Thermoanaerobaculia bacterium]|nr:FG-GAP-like repeat-containing protein [Thermoanaerobaculia bacterium]